MSYAVECENIATWFILFSVCLIHAVIVIGNDNPAVPKSQTSYNFISTAFLVTIPSNPEVSVPFIKVALPGSSHKTLAVGYAHV